MSALELMATVLVALVVFSRVDAQSRGERRNRLRNRDREHDASHVREHLEGVVDMNQQEQLSADEQHFQFFKVHDYDNNKMLDGIELISAFLHYHHEEHPDDWNPVSQEDLEMLADSILRDEDANDDGYIDYLEFMRSQRA